MAFNIDTLRITDLTEEQMAEDDNMTTANVASTIKKRTSTITPKNPENQGAQVAEKVEQVANLRSILKSKRDSIIPQKKTCSMNVYRLPLYK